MCDIFFLSYEEVLGKDHMTGSTCINKCFVTYSEGQILRGEGRKRDHFFFFCAFCSPIYSYHNLPLQIFFLFRIRVKRFHLKDNGIFSKIFPLVLKLQKLVFRWTFSYYQYMYYQALKHFHRQVLPVFNSLIGARAYQLDFEITGLSYFKSFSLVFGDFFFFFDLLSSCVACIP